MAILRVFLSLIYASRVAGFTPACINRHEVLEARRGGVTNFESALRACKKYKLDDDDLMNLIHPRGFSCFGDYGISSRTARIQIPLHTIASALATLASSSPALADEVELSAENPKSEPDNTENQDHPVTESKTEENEGIPEPAVDESPPAVDKSSPVDDEKRDDEDNSIPETPTVVEEQAVEKREELVFEPEPVASSDKPKTTTKAKTFDEALKQYFPNSLPTTMTATMVENCLNSHKFTRGNSIFATCVCPDEVNNKPKSLTHTLQSALTDLNGSFQLGGLAGLPYLGVSGMKNFLSHAPKNGKVFIMFGSHVGITDEGVVGNVERLGRGGTTLDCDTTLNALTVAQSRNKANNNESNGSSKIGTPDRREEYIVSKLRTALESEEASKLSENDLPAYATYQMFELIKEQLMKQLNACTKEDAWGGEIDEAVLLGGIIVNRGQLAGSIEPREDYFLPIVFESYSEPGSSVSLPEAEDLFHSTFGRKSVPFYAR